MLNRAEFWRVGEDISKNFGCLYVLQQSLFLFDRVSHVLTGNVNFCITSINRLITRKMDGALAITGHCCSKYFILIEEMKGIEAKQHSCKSTSGI